MKNDTDYLAANLKFSRALAIILEREGGFVDNKKDPGGATNLGITQHTLDAYQHGHNFATFSVQALTKMEAANIYRQNYWSPLGLDGFPYPIALMLFDTSVQWGVRGAIEMACEICPRSVGRINASLIERAKDEDPRTLIEKIYQWRRAFRWKRIAKRPDQICFLLGWNNRDKYIRQKALDSLTSSPAS